MVAASKIDIKILCIVCAGPGSNDERRVKQLMTVCGLVHEIVYVDKSLSVPKRMLSIYQSIVASNADLMFIEGTGVAGGLPALLGRLTGAGPQKYIISSGDAVDSFIKNRHGRVLGLLARLYETTLYREAFGFAGWTPYLVGRAIRMGARRGLTLEGFVPDDFQKAPASSGQELRATLGIADTDLVVGVTGSINWSEKQSYCYGLELVTASKLTSRPDVRFLIVGDGSGLELLKERTKDDARFIFSGRVPHSDIPRYLSMLDVAVIAQTSDEAGALRLTTKLPEYLAAGVPVAMSATPGAIDFLYEGNSSPIWLIPAHHPASPAFAKEIAAWIDALEITDIRRRKSNACKIADDRFNASRISGRLVGFLDAYSGVTN